MANSSQSRSAKQWINRLSAPPRIDTLDPIAARFIYSLRIIALHDRVKRDPVPELAARLGSVEVAAKALALGQAISSTWPENIQISRFCCTLISHDEFTIGEIVGSAGNCDRAGFEGAIEGLIRPDRMQRLWDSALDLVAAEARLV